MNDLAARRPLGAEFSANVTRRYINAENGHPVERLALQKYLNRYKAHSLSEPIRIGSLISYSIFWYVISKYLPDRGSLGVNFAANVNRGYIINAGSAHPVELFAQKPPPDIHPKTHLAQLPLLTEARKRI